MKFPKSENDIEEILENNQKRYEDIERENLEIGKKIIFDIYSMIIEGQDGVTHINIYSKGKTEIGRWLSNFTQVELVLEEGVFQSIEGYWYYISTEDERFKVLSGYSAKKLGKELTEEKVLLSEIEFRKKIKKALDVKIKTLPKWLANSKLPFCHYYEYGDKRVDAKYEWIVEHIERRRRELKEYYYKKYQL